MRVLVVDDDPICRTIVAIHLKALGGIEVTEAEDGDKAWALLKRIHFDGAVVDWQMPGKSGLEIVREIRKARIAMPLLMVTGESEKEQVIKAIQAGINDYLIKPFDAETLREKLGRFVGLTRPRTPPGAGLSPASAGIADVAPASAGDTAVAPLSPAGQA